MTRLTVLAGMLLVVLVTAMSAALLIPAHKHASRHQTTSAAAGMMGMHMQMEQAAAQTPAAPAEPAVGSSLALTSYAGVTPDNADALAAAHPARDATLPALQPGPVAHVRLVAEPRVIEIAPGVKYAAWTFNGSAPGPILHVRQGQTVKVTLVNDSMMGHSIDLHAALAAPNQDFMTVPGHSSTTFSFKAENPGVFMYHCGTAPALAHIANGMYGAIVVEPKDMPPANEEYVLVGSEFYLNGPGTKEPAYLDMTKARAMLPDWMTFNGYAGQYKDHPLTAKPGDTVRFWVVDAGPNENLDFHVVGSILERAWVDADMSQYQHDVQTAIVPAGGGGVFDVKIDQPGLYPFVSHSFAAVDLGEVGVLRVGDVPGTMNH